MNEKNKKLYMIGNSHIDPVWLWVWEEGMQEVKATFASALDRMNEYEDFIFTSTSTVFLKWIEKTVPCMFKEIQKRVAEERWELTGGWFIEPDCILPCGEAFVRQGLYGQRYLKDKFGNISRIGSNVDSFGHGHTLPQILRKSGIDSYVFMRPRLKTPVFVWESDDNSRVNAICLPAEYTTWFHEPTVRNIKQTLERTPEWPKMVCCYGVGNHGGGPTKENIESIINLKESFADTTLEFSTFDRFLNDIDNDKLETLKGPFEKVNEGCYSVDSPIKKLNRLSETRLIEADGLMAIAALVSGGWIAEAGSMQSLWETVLFNQFHDTLGGTSIKKARDEAVMQLSSVCAQAGYIKALAVQGIANSIDTRGEGFPLIIVNTRGTPFDGYVNTEFEWFCRDSLAIIDHKGNEVPYQRVATDTRIKHTVLGGRRRVVFRAAIPPFGFSVYRLLKRDAEVTNQSGFLYTEDNYCLENEYIKAEFDKVSGRLKGLWDKENKYNALISPIEYQVWLDERDTWGHDQGRAFGFTGECFTLKAIEKVEKGALRQTIRAVYQHGGSVLAQHFHLHAGEKGLEVESRLYWDKPWYMFKIALPLGISSPCVRSEAAYGTLERNIKDSDEYYMHRWLDVTQDEGRGCAITNDSKYSFNIDKGKVQLTVLRSAVYAQGQSPGWYDPKENFIYSDIGEHEFTYVLRPHGTPLKNHELISMADRTGTTCEVLADNNHTASIQGGRYHPCTEASQEPSLFTFSLAHTSSPEVQIRHIKKAEDDEDFIVRLLETEGKEKPVVLSFLGMDFTLKMDPNEIKTLKINPNKHIIIEVNLLEWKE